MNLNRITMLIRCGSLAMLLAMIAASSFLASSASSKGSRSDAVSSASATAVSALRTGRLFVSSIGKSGKAEIKTDKKDYAPGERVVITGSGWKPRETVTLRVRRSTGSPDELFVVRVDPTGRFRHEALRIKPTDLGVAFRLTAVGSSSKYTAEIAFTDGNITIKPAYEGQTNAGGLQTFTLTKRIFTGSTNCTTCGSAPTTVTGVDATTGHTFALASTDSALISAPAFSDQNGPFSLTSGWFSPTMSAFTTIMDGTSRNICIPGTATGTYVAPFKAGVITLASDCMTPKSSFNLGDTVCVKVFGDPALIASCGGPKFFAISMEDPNGASRNCTPDCLTDTSAHVTMDQGTYSFTLPATNGAMGADNRGPWKARVLDCLGTGLGSATFQVHNPTAGQEAADIQVLKSAISSPVPPNGTIQYDIFVGNIGPDPAQTVSFTDTIPANTTFVSFQQNSGPVFSCMTPAVGGTGTVTCTLATLPVGAGSSAQNDPATAAFRLVVKVNNVVGDGSISITNSATVTSATTETHPTSNTASAGTIPVLSTACSLTCPADITVTASGTCNAPPFNCGPGAVVNYSTATATGSCGAITCNPPSGSCFPVGTTTVGCGENNAVCVFRVVVNAPPACTLTCPANITVPNDPNMCGAAVTYPAPTTTGTCGTVVCVPPSGSTFQVGTTTVTCKSNNNAGPETCTFTVTVNDTQAPVITCPSNVIGKTTNLNDPCKVVNFTATASDNCPGVTVLCNPPSGTCFPLGSTTVTCTATDASSNTATCSFKVTIFNVCLQDDSNPKIVFLGNSVTGDYQFCCGGTLFTGKAVVTRVGNIVAFQHDASDRRVLAKDDEGVFKGTATIQNPPGIVKCTIGDRDTRNNTCACP